MRRQILSGLAVLLVLVSLQSECRAEPPRDAEEGPGTRIGGFFRELVGYLKRRDRVGVGDLAPDFALGEPDAERNAAADVYRGVRLSAFRGVRPVALIFGSYT